MGSAVFLSYVRSTAASAARALNQSLGEDVCFLDTDDIAAGEVFPERLTDAILGAQVFVAFLDETYFQRWYCLREWLLARAPLDEVLRRGVGPSASLDAVHHGVVALEPRIDERVVARLPPVLRQTNWPDWNATSALEKLIRSRLEGPVFTRATWRGSRGHGSQAGSRGVRGASRAEAGRSVE